MGCSCEHKKLSGDIERIRRLAKALAVSEGEAVGIYRNADGSYGFAVVSSGIDKPIIEYISSE